MAHAVAIRLAVAVATFFAATAAIYLGLEALPGDPATTILGPEGTPAQVEDLRARMQLDEPVLERYVDWLSGALTGDLGESFATGDARAVWPLIERRIGYTLVLAGVTLALLIPISLTLGIVSAVRRGGVIDSLIAGTTLTFVAVPEFVVGILLVLVFAVWIGALPAVSLVDSSASLFSQPDVLVLPVATLLITSLASTTRMVRGCMIDVLRTEYVEMARLKGASERRVLVKHALPNALGPTIQIYALNAASLVGGIVIVETVFGFPGIGSYLTSSVAAHDVATVEAIALLVTAVYITMNALASLSVIVLNPRLRRQAA